jgi:hypothetical protein
MSSQWEVEFYRKQARECDSLADRYHDYREVWLEQARRWRELADMIDKEKDSKGVGPEAPPALAAPTRPTTEVLADRPLSQTDLPSKFDQKDRHE